MAAGKKYPLPTTLGLKPQRGDLLIGAFKDEKSKE